MADQANAYPLSWPTGWKRTPAHQRGHAAFGAMKARQGSSYAARTSLTLEEARGRLVRELSLLGAINELLSTNIALRRDGWPKSGQAKPTDPGAACYFEYAGKATVLACDKWERVEDNIAAIAKHIEAIRGMDRWGVGSLEQAFTGYAALPAPLPWHKVLPMNGRPAEEWAIEAAWKEAAKDAHPDLPGGSHDKMTAINLARDAGLAEVRAR